MRTHTLLGDSGDCSSFLSKGAVSTEEVAEFVVWGLEAETFLILSHAQVLEYFRRKGADYDRWLRGMRRLNAKVKAEFGE